MHPPPLYSPEAWGVPEAEIPALPPPSSPSQLPAHTSLQCLSSGLKRGPRQVFLSCVCDGCGLRLGAWARHQECRESRELRAGLGLGQMPASPAPHGTSRADLQPNEQEQSREMKCCLEAAVSRPVLLTPSGRPRPHRLTPALEVSAFPRGPRSLWEWLLCVLSPTSGNKIGEPQSLPRRPDVLSGRPVWDSHSWMSWSGSGEKPWNTRGRGRSSHSYKKMLRNF